MTVPFFSLILRLLPCTLSALLWITGKKKKRNNASITTQITIKTNYHKYLCCGILYIDIFSWDSTGRSSSNTLFNSVELCPWCMMYIVKSTDSFLCPDQFICLSVAQDSKLIMVVFCRHRIMLCVTIYIK